MDNSLFYFWLGVISGFGICACLCRWVLKNSLSSLLMNLRSKVVNGWNGSRLTIVIDRMHSELLKAGPFKFIEWVEKRLL